MMMMMMMMMNLPFSVQRHVLVFLVLLGSSREEGHAWISVSRPPSPPPKMYHRYGQQHHGPPFLRLLQRGHP